MSHENLVKPLNDAIDAWYEKSKSLYNLKNWKRPKLDIVSLTGSCAGKALWPNNEMHVNWTLYTQNPESFLQRTVPHETAHLVNFVLNGHRADSHGLGWKSIMQRIGAKDLTPCHSYDTTSVRAVIMTFEYRCIGCGNVQYCDSKTHYQVVGNKVRDVVLTCRRCRNVTKFTGKTKRM